MKPRLFRSDAGMRAFLASRTRPDAYHVLVIHDPSCSPSRCGCRPWFEVRELTADNVLEGAQLEAQWKKERAS